jgi:hypothetical protein
MVSGPLWSGAVVIRFLDEVVIVTSWPDDTGVRPVSSAFGLSFLDLFESFAQGSPPVLREKSPYAQ